MVFKVASVLACLSPAWALGHQQAQGARRNGCDCLEFAGVYYDNLASCGRAHELYFATKYGASAAYSPTEPIAGLPHQVCNNFFKNFKNNSCVNVDMYPYPSENNDASSGRQWCYVSNDCLNLNGGTFATNKLGFAMGGWNNLQSTSNLSVKFCDDSTDDILKSKTMDELLTIASESDVSIPMLLRLSYPAVQVTWGEAKLLMEEINNNYDSALTLAENVNAIAAAPGSWGPRLTTVDTTIRSVVLSEQGTILEGPGHRDEFRVIIGREVWEVVRLDNPAGNMAYLAGKFFLEFNANCVMGCSPSKREEPLDLLTQ